MVVVHVSAMLVMVGAITYVRAPKLDPTAALYVAQSEREWAAAAIEAIYTAFDQAAKILLAAFAVFVALSRSPTRSGPPTPACAL